MPLREALRNIIDVTREEIDVLIRRCELVSRERPRLYLARIVGLVILAYGYLLLGTLALPC